MRSHRIGARLAVVWLGLLPLCSACTRVAEQTAPERIRSVAILPFSLASGPVTEAYLTSALAADLDRRLRLLDNLQMLPRSEAATFAGTLGEQQRVARELGAELTIQGRVTVRAGRLELALEIVDAATSAPSRNTELSDTREQLFDLQRRAARWVVQSLDLQLDAETRAALRRAPARALKAWEYAARGQLYLDQLDNPRGPDFALDLFDRALQLDPDFALAHLGLSEALWLSAVGPADTRRLTEAELHARWVLARQPRHPQAIVLLTKIYQSSGRDGPARPHTPIEVGRLSKPDEALREVASGLLRIGRLEAAESALRQAESLRPGLWLNAYTLGRFLLRGGRLGEAEQAFESAVTSSPPSLIRWPLQKLLATRLAQGDFQRAVDLFSTLQPETLDADTLLRVGGAQATLGDAEGAARTYRVGLERDPRNHELHRELGDLLRHRGQDEAASSHYGQALSHVEGELQGRPLDKRLQFDFAGLAARSGDCRRALPVAERLWRSTETSMVDFRELAISLALCRQTSLARETLIAGLDLGLDPTFVRSEPAFRQLFAADDLARILSEAGGPPPSP